MSDNLIGATKDIEDRTRQLAIRIRTLDAALTAERNAALTQPPTVDRDRVHTSGTTDPTATTVINALTSRNNAYHQAQHKLDQLTQAVAGITRALEHAERAIAANQPGHPTVYDTTMITRCKGWNVDLRARLGGCGNHLEEYTRTDHTKGLRDLCSRCRKAQQRAEKDQDT